MTEEKLKEAFIIDGVRTPIGNLGGSLSSVRADDLAAFAIVKLLEKQPHLPIQQIEDVVFGCANQAGEDNRNVARMAALLAGLPITVAGQTINRLCASGLSAVANAAREIQTGSSEVMIAGGVEQMTRAPWVMSKADAAFSRKQELYDTTLGWRFVNKRMQELYGTDSMGETAENVAREHKISREDQDRFALWSQQKALEARERGRFEKEIAPVHVKEGKGAERLFDHDEFIKPASNLDVLAKLKPAFRADGSVTAGNSSGLNDGSCALLLGSRKACEQHSLRARAKFVAAAVVGVEPRLMGLGPIEASKRCLERARLTLKDIALIELNEAFASQSLACLRSLGLKDNDSRVNVNGGAIALGHPLGMSGARLILTAMVELEERSERYALCTMCVGVGQGAAVVIERCR